MLSAPTVGGVDELVFPPSRGNGRMPGFRKIWNRITMLGEVPSDVTPHTLRHNFASVASDLGYSEPTIAAMVGHAGRTMASRHVHSAEAVLLAAADAVADRISELMGEPGQGGRVVKLRQSAG